MLAPGSAGSFDMQWSRTRVSTFGKSSIFVRGILLIYQILGFAANFFIKIFAVRQYIWYEKNFTQRTCCNPWQDTSEKYPRVYPWTTGTRPTSNQSFPRGRRRLQVLLGRLRGKLRFLQKVIWTWRLHVKLSCDRHVEAEQKVEARTRWHPLITLAQGMDSTFNVCQLYGIHFLQKVLFASQLFQWRFPARAQPK